MQAKCWKREWGNHYKQYNSTIRIPVLVHWRPKRQTTASDITDISFVSYNSRTRQWAEPERSGVDHCTATGRPGCVGPTTVCPVCPSRRPWMSEHDWRRSQGIILEGTAGGSNCARRMEGMKESGMFSIFQPTTYHIQARLNVEEFRKEEEWSQWIWIDLLCKAVRCQPAYVLWCVVQCPWSEYTQYVL